MIEARVTEETKARWDAENEKCYRLVALLRAAGIEAIELDHGGAVGIASPDRKEVWRLSSTWHADFKRK